MKLSKGGSRNGPAKRLRESSSLIFDRATEGFFETEEELREEMLEMRPW